MYQAPVSGSFSKSEAIKEKQPRGQEIYVVALLTMPAATPEVFTRPPCKTWAAKPSQLTQQQVDSFFQEVGRLSEWSVSDSGCRDCRYLLSKLQTASTLRERVLVSSFLII